jgi:membrane protein
MAVKTKTGTRSPQAKAKRTATRAKAEAKSWADHIQRWLPPPIRGIVARAREDDILLLSAGLAFYAVISIVPLTLLVVSVVALILGDQRIQQLAEAAGRMAPRDLAVDELIKQIAHVATRASIVAFVTGLWPATSYGAGVSRAFNDLSPRKESTMRGLRGRGLLLIVILPVFLLGALVGSYAGSQALGGSTLGRIAGAVIALLTGFLGGAIAMILIYRIFPPVRLPWNRIVVATGFTAASLAFVSLAFVLYLAVGANFQEHYASSGLATFIMLAVWVFLGQVLMLVGYKMAMEGEQA